MHFGQKILTIGQKFFRQCSRFFIVRVQDKISDGNFFWKFFFPLFLWLWVTKSKTLSYIFLSRLLMKVILRFQKTRKKATKWGKLRFYTFFLEFLSGKFMHFAQNRWGSVFKTAFYVPRKKLWRKLFSKKSNSMLLLGLWAERFRTLNENFLHVS